MLAGWDRERGDDASPRPGAPGLIGRCDRGFPRTGRLGSRSEVVRITDDGFRGPAELSVAINPADPENVVVVSLAAGPPEGPRTTNYAYVSEDGGRGWTTVAQPNPDGRTQGDDAVTFDAQGRAFRSYISFDGIRVPRPTLAWNGIFVSRSDDGGMSWGDPVPVVDHINTVEPFEDKPWVVTDIVEGSPHQGNVYVAWTRFDVYGSADPADSTQILFSRSVDGGGTFSVPSASRIRGGTPWTAMTRWRVRCRRWGRPDRFTWLGPGPEGHRVRSVLDGGGPSERIGSSPANPGGWDIPLSGMARHNGLPVTGVDVSAGPDRGTVYVNWIDERNGDTDVFLIASRDGGESWGDPVRVNDDPVGNGRAQLFTWMAVDPTDGSLNVVFLDRRITEGNAQTVTLARSTDGGKSSVTPPSIRIPSSAPNRSFLETIWRSRRSVAGWWRPGPTAWKAGSWLSRPPFSASDLRVPTSVPQLFPKPAILPRIVPVSSPPPRAGPAPGESLRWGEPSRTGGTPVTKAGPQDADPQGEAGLHRALGPFDATMVVVGGIIGAGIFINPYIVAQRLDSPVWVLSAWVVGGLIAMAGALTFAELGVVHPKAGGHYAYLREAFHPLLGFLYGWALLFMIETGAIAAVSITFAEYTLRLLGREGVDALPLAVAAIVVVGGINALGIKTGKPGPERPGGPEGAGLGASHRVRSV